MRCGLLPGPHNRPWLNTAGRGAVRRAAIIWAAPLSPGNWQSHRCLLTGAGLLGRSLLRVLATDPGFHTEHVITVDLALSFAAKDADKTHRIQFLDQLLRQMRAIPGVQEVGGTGHLPLTDMLANGTYVLLAPGDQPPHAIEQLETWSHNAARTGYANYSPASDGYFRALRNPDTSRTCTR